MDSDAVLLIGSTGMGKSTLGNFLLDPDHKQEYFKVGRTNYPETQKTSAITVNVKLHPDDTCAPKPLTVIDSPGLNESTKTDMEHMRKLIEELENFKTLKACILVLKFDARIDQQCNDTIQFYSQLLPAPFKKNLIIVLTNYQTNERSEDLRRSEGYDINVVAKNFKDQVRKLSEIDYEPSLFLIDCKPYRKISESNNEVKTSINKRKVILSNIFSMTPVETQKIRVLRSKAMIACYEKKICICQGEINGFTLQMERTNKDAKNVLQKLRKDKQDITTIRLDLNQQLEELQQKNTDEHVTVASWVLDDSWKFWQWPWKTKKIEGCTSKWDATHYYKHCGERCEFKDLVCTPNKATGSVEGEFISGLNAKVFLLAPSKVRYAEEILKLNESIQRKQEQLNQLEKNVARLELNYPQFRSQIRTLKVFIAKKETEITKFFTEKSLLTDIEHLQLN